MQFKIGSRIKSVKTGLVATITDIVCTDDEIGEPDAEIHFTLEDGKTSYIWLSKFTNHKFELVGEGRTSEGVSYDPSSPTTTESDIRPQSSWATKLGVVPEAHNSEEAKQIVLKRFPDAQSVQDGVGFKILTNGKNIGYGYSEASAWVDALSNKDNKIL
jgi:hypothetical protein